MSAIPSLAPRANSATNAHAAAMQQALTILGFPCYHGLTLLASPRDSEMWNAVLDAKYFGRGARLSRAEWDQLLGAYGAVADLPAVALAEDLLAAYPTAKVVLVERELEAWYRSFDATVMVNMWSPLLRALARLDARFLGRLAGTSGRWTRGWLRARSLREMRERTRPRVPCALCARQGYHAARTAARIRAGRRVGSALRVLGRAGPGRAVS